jgi:putative (di)nucleoside polyphosphate hydrolase
MTPPKKSPSSTKTISKQALKDLPYRPCVGIVLFNKNGHVFVGERLDNPGAWQLPQGGVDDGESVEQAAMRELYEETGTNSAELISIMDEQLSYDLPDHLLGRLWNGAYKGQIQTWVSMRFTGYDQEITLYGGMYPEFGRWKWVDLDDICDMIVPFKRKTYQKVIDHFKPVRDKLLEV